MSTNAKHMFRFDSLPKMEKALGNEKASVLLDDIINESKSDSKLSQDYGCICEIDLSQVSTIKSIMAKMVQRIEDGSSLEE